MSRLNPRMRAANLPSDPCPPSHQAATQLDQKVGSKEPRMANDRSFPTVFDRTGNGFIRIRSRCRWIGHYRGTIAISESWNISDLEWTISKGGVDEIHFHGLYLRVGSIRRASHGTPIFPSSCEKGLLVNSSGPRSGVGSDWVS